MKRILIIAALAFLVAASAVAPASAEATYLTDQEAWNEANWRTYADSTTRMDPRFYDSATWQWKYRHSSVEVEWYISQWYTYPGALWRCEYRLKVREWADSRYSFVHMNPFGWCHP